MFNVSLAGGHKYGKQLSTWLSLVVSFMASFVLPFFPLDVLDGIWDLIESVSEGFFLPFLKRLNIFNYSFSYFKIFLPLCTTNFVFKIAAWPCIVYVRRRICFGEISVSKNNSVVGL